MPSVTTALPSLAEQAERLIELDVHRIAGLPADRLRNLPDSAGSLLVVHPELAPASALAPLLRVNGKPGFVVTDMSDVDEFTPISSVKLPDAPLYLVTRPRPRGRDGQLESRRGVAGHRRCRPDAADPHRGSALAAAATGRACPRALLHDDRVAPTANRAGRWTPGRPRCGSATAPAATGLPTATRRRSAGAGRETGTPGSDSPRPVVESR